MTRVRFLSTTALALTFFGSASFADVTGADVWADWKSYLAGLGYEVTGSEAQAGETLTITDLAMVFPLPEGEGDVSLTMKALTFTDGSDGTVPVGLPAQIPLSFNVVPDGEDTIAGTLLMEHTGTDMRVSGEPGDLLYSYKAADVSISLSDVVADGDPVPPEIFGFMMSASDVLNETRVKLSDQRAYEGTFTAADLTYDITFESPDPSEPGAGTFQGTLNGVNVTANGNIPVDGDASDPANLLSSGLTADATLAFTSGSSNARLVAPEGSFSTVSQSTGGTLGMTASADGIRYDLAQTGVAVTAQVPEFPAPVSIAMAESTATFAMPVEARDTAQPFALGFKIGDFSISDAVWSLFDPSGQLPRDPATIELDLTGTAKVLTNLLSDEGSVGGNVVPGTLETLDIRTILIDMVGATLSGSGAFSFDSSDTVTFDGMPRPEGALDLRLEGANVLLDTLVNMGILPQEQAMGARMMMGIFAVPDGADALTSKIEVNADGHVLANGQRLR